MMRKGVKFVAVAAAVGLVLSAGFKGGAGPAKGPLAEWVYPKAKPTGEGGNQPPLTWRVYTTKDPFEKVWKFYEQKPIEGLPVAPLKEKGRAGHTSVIATPQDPKQVCAQFHDPNPKGKIAVMVFRQKDRTVSVTIWQRAGEKETNILVAVDQR